MFVNVNFATSFRLYFGASLVAQTVEKSACTQGDPCSISGVGDPEGNGSPFRYSLLGKSHGQRICYKLFCLYNSIYQTSLGTLLCGGWRVKDVKITRKPQALTYT